MFKLFVFLALVAVAIAVPKAAPQYISSLYGGYGGLGYSNLGYTGYGNAYGYAAPYAHGGIGNYFY